jgi:hypothetical protein
MEQAVGRVGRSLFPEEWDGCPTSAEIAQAAVQRDEAEKALTAARKRELWPDRKENPSDAETLQMRRFRQLESVRGIPGKSGAWIAPRSARDEEDAQAQYVVQLDEVDVAAIKAAALATVAVHRARWQRCWEARSKLRLLLHEGFASAVVLATNGHQYQIATPFWASIEAPEAIERGEATYQPGICGARMPVGIKLFGVVLVAEGFGDALIRNAHPRPRSPADTSGKLPLTPTTLRKWFQERVERVRNGAAQPSREDDEADAEKYFGRRASRPQLRALRKELAPDWNEPGRPNKTGKKKTGID